MTKVLTNHYSLHRCPNHVQTEPSNRSPALGVPVECIGIGRMTIPLADPNLLYANIVKCEYVPSHFKKDLYELHAHVVMMPQIGFGSSPVSKSRQIWEHGSVSRRIQARGV